MKGNVLHRFAFQDLKKHKKDFIWISITIFVVTFTTMLVTLTSPMFFNQRYLEHQRINGTYDYYGFFDSLDEINNFKFMIDDQYLSIHDSKVQSCIKMTSGTTFNSESIGEIKGDKSVLSTHIKEGREPDNKDEVAIKSQVFRNWGYEEKLNTTITISYTSHEKSYVKEFKVVGILEDTGNLDILSSRLPVEEYSVYLDLEYGKTIQNTDTSHVQRYVVPNDFSMSQEGTAIVTVFIQAIICVISLSLLYGLTLSSFEKRQKDYTLLRSIGATKRQIYYVILVQSLLLSIVPILSSLLLVFILSQIIPYVFHLAIPMPFDMLQMIWNIFVVVFIVFLSYFLPARSSTRNSLIGTFDGQEFQYFYYRYKKLYQMKPFYLGWRQLVALKKKMIIKIFLISITVLCCMRFISDPLITNFLQESNQKEDMQNGLTIEFTPLEDEIFNKQDFKDLNLLESLSFYQYIDSQEVMKNFSLNAEAGYPTIYCENKNLLMKYGIKELKPNQIAVSHYYLKQNGMEDNKNKTIDFFGQSYQLAYILDTYYDSLIIMNGVDYQKYVNMKQTTKAVMTFDSVQQKSQMYNNHAKTLQSLNHKYYKSDVFMESLMDNDLSSSKPNMSQFFYSLVIVSMGVIYIYQFAFELLKQREDIGTYQLLGLRKKEIWQIYFYKSLFIGGISLILGSAYFYADIYIRYQFIDIEKVLYSLQMIFSTFGLGTCVMVSILTISLIPLFSIMKKGGLENKNINE